MAFNLMDSVKRVSWMVLKRKIRCKMVLNCKKKRGPFRHHPLYYHWKSKTLSQFFMCLWAAFLKSQSRKKISEIAGFQKRYLESQKTPTSKPPLIQGKIRHISGRRFELKRSVKPGGIHKNRFIKSCNQNYLLEHPEKRRKCWIFHKFPPTARNSRLLSRPRYLGANGLEI